MPASLTRQAASTVATEGAAETTTFDQCRDWWMRFIEARQVQIAAELAKNLIDARCASLQRQKAQYDNFPAIPTADRDRLFSERFDQIDASRGGVIDRNAWHDKQRAFDDRSDYGRETANGERSTIPPAA